MRPKIRGCQELVTVGAGWHERSYGAAGHSRPWDIILVCVGLQTSLFNYGMVHLTMVGYSFVHNGMVVPLA
jgi:hypothetical protein